jgi:hypothetical protein
MKVEILTDMQVVWFWNDDYAYAISGVPAILISFPNKGKYAPVLN